MNLSDRWHATSPFITEGHVAWAQVVRRFVDREITPGLERWERERMVPREIHKRAGEVGILGLGHPEEFGGASNGIDVFYKLLQIDELARTGAGGIVAGFTLHELALGAILKAGSDPIKQRVAPEIISGEKIIAFGSTEPSGGSDVAAYKTRAVKKGGHYVVNGSKIFITNGMRADYILTVVRTGGEGMKGLSLLLIDAHSKGLQRTPLEKMGFHSSDTATLYFEDVEVPEENLVGMEGGGFGPVGHAFNIDRLHMAQHCCSFARVALEDAIIYASQRETFGKLLSQHQVIRVKLANMMRQVEATQAYIEKCAWNHQASKANAADFAMLKVQATYMMEAVVRDAAQVLGGAGVLLGSRVERLSREVRINAIAGGSEEILLDFAGRHLGF